MTTAFDSPPVRAPGSSPTSTASSRSAGPRVKQPYLTAVPDSAPPFDDEQTPLSRLAVLVEQRRQRERDPLGSPASPATIADAAVPQWSREADVGVRKTLTGSLGPIARTGSVLARALVEVLSGQRAVAQLRVHCAPEVYAGLENRPVVRGQAGQLMNVRICEPADGVAEVSAVFRRGDRVRAIAFRLQGLDGRWRITALQTA